MPEPEFHTYQMDFAMANASSNRRNFSLNLARVLVGRTNKEQSPPLPAPFGLGAGPAVDGERQTAQQE